MTDLPWQASPAAGPAARRARGRKLPFLCALVGGLVAGTAMARAAGPQFTIGDPWMRLITASRPAAGYFTLSNNTDEARVLVGAASPACGTLMLHQSLQQNGQERMVTVKSITVPAHGSVTFAPGGYYLMCRKPAKDMIVGGSVVVTLRFENGGELTTSFPVRGATGK